MPGFRDRFARLPLALLLAFAFMGHDARLARAQEQIGLETSAQLELEAELEPEGFLKDFDVRVGMLAAVSPEYEGASEYEVDAVPYARISWRDRVVLRARSLDINVLKSGPLRAGPMLKSRGGRNDNRDRSLRGLGDVDRAFEAGAFLRFKNGPYRIRVNALFDVADAHEGAVVEMRAGVRIPLSKPWFTLQLSSTWADGDYMSSFFGVSALQSRRSILRRFNAEAGFKDVRLAVGSRLEITEHISAVTSLGYSRLLGDAADSPIVADHGERDQFFAAFGATYRF